LKKAHKEPLTRYHTYN